MKNLLFLFLAVPLMAMTGFGLQEIGKALGNGDAATLGAHFDSSVEISIMDEADLYDKSEAIQAVKSFFAKYPPTSCSQVHQGSSKGKDSQYTIFSLNTNGQKFRVFMYMKSVGSKEVIQELSIDKE